MRTFCHLFCLTVMIGFCAGISAAWADTGAVKSQGAKSPNSSKFYNPNGTKFYDPSPLPKVKFEWPEFKFPKFEFPNFFEQSGESETASGEQQLKAAAKPDSAAQGEDELLTHMNQMSGVLEKIKEILRNYAASHETSGVEAKAQHSVKAPKAAGPTAVSGEGNLQALLGDLLAAQKDAPKIDPAKALDMAYAVKEKADQKRLEMEEEVRRMEEGY